MNPAITKLKDDLVLAETKLRQYSRLMIEREELANKIEKLKKEIASSQQLAAFKEKLKELDHLLDELEDISPTTVKSKKDLLIHQILLDFPEHQEWLFKLEMANQQVDSLYKLQELCKKIQEILEIVTYTRQTIKGRGFLNYIFGTSPNLIIERHLLEGHRILEAGIPFLSPAQHPLFSASFLEEMGAFLKALQKQFQATWGFSHIDKIFAPAKEQITLYLDKIQEQHLEIEDLKQKIESWLRDL